MLSACKHLDYDESKYDQCELVTLPGRDPPVRHWKRLILPYEDAPVNVQFCKLRGRINDIFSCYGERSCHDLEVGAR